MYNVIICCDSASSLYDRLCAVRHYFEAPVFGGEERPLNLLETGRVSQISAQAPILILPKALHEPVIGSGAVFAVIANSDFFQRSSAASFPEPRFSPVECISRTP